MTQRLKLIGLIFFCIVYLSPTKIFPSDKGGKIVKTQSPLTNKINSGTLDSVLEGINNFLSRADIVPQNKSNNILSNSKSPTVLSKFNKGYSLPSFKTLQGGIKNIKWDEYFGTPRLIAFKQQVTTSKLNKTLSKEEAITTSTNFLINEKSLLKINDPQKEFSLSNVQSDELGMAHIRYKQIYNGIEVWAKDIYVHLNSQGDVVLLNGRYAPTPVSITNLVPELTSNNAIEYAKVNLQTKTELGKLSGDTKRLLHYAGPTAKKIIWFDSFQIPHLVWLVEIRPSLDQDWYYFVDANDGTILNSYNNVNYDGPSTGSGVDLNGVTQTFGTYQVGQDYFMIDASQPMYNSTKSQIPQNPVGAIVGLDLQNTDLSAQSTFYFVTSTDNQWNDPASVSANYNALQTYKYYYQVFNRNSIDDSSMTIYSTIHVTQDNKSMENAFWSGNLMCYGDGGQYFKPLAGGLDVAAHEMTHGVTQHSAGLIYQNQSGALNESISDVLGTLVDSANWTLGENVVKDLNAYPTGALRDMADPHNGGSQSSPSWQPAKMSEFINTTQDNGGVHINSGIPNHAFYLVASVIGRHKAGAIWYRALTKYLTRSAQFIDARLATIQSATDLYGDTSPEVNSVKAGWDEVEIFDGSGTPPPPPSQIVGQDWILAASTDQSDPYSIYMVNPTIQSNSDIHPLTNTSIENRPAVSDTSGIIIFVDQDHNLRGMYADLIDPQEQYIDESGVWESVSIGPGLSSIALTSIYVDTTIYYFDLVNQTSETFKIKSQSYDGPDANTALYADAMSFDLTGQYILFDAYNEIKDNLGGQISFWNINILDITSGQILNIFPSLPKGKSVGNPSFSKTSNNRFTFDYYSDDTNADYILTMDFNSSNLGTVAGPLPVIGYPTFSKDDRTIAYHNLETYQSNPIDAVEKMSLDNDMLNGTGNAESYLIGATYPVWFVIGSRITDVDEKGNGVPQSFKLEQNYPNPFNPSTTIRYSIPSEGLITLKVYNAIGEEIMALVNEVKRVGNYEVKFNASSMPSGVYFYRLLTNSFAETKKMILLK